MWSKFILFCIKEIITFRFTLKKFFQLKNTPLYRTQQARYFKKTAKRINLFLIVASTIVFIFGIRLGVLYISNIRTHGNTFVELNGINNAKIVALAENLPSTKRTDILDVNGTIIATSIPDYSVFMKHSEVSNLFQTLTTLRSLFPNLPLPYIQNRIKKHKDFIWIAYNINEQQMKILKKHHLNGVYIIPTQRRIYPQGSLMSEVVGMVGRDQTGLTGIEYALNKRIMNSKRPLQLTIDTRIQYIVKSALKSSMRKWHADAAIGIVMSVQTGNVVAMVSLPDFNPNDPSHTTENQRFNRATLGVYELGSVFKIINTALALESGKIQMNDQFPVRPNLNIGKYEISDGNDHHQQKLNVAKIFIYSSNIGSAKMAMEIGIKKQKEFIKKLHFAPTASFPIAAQGKALFPKKWDSSSLITISYGHGISVSPLQFITAISSLVGESYLLQPNLLIGHYQKKGPLLISSNTRSQLRKLLRINVLLGTGKKAQIPGYMIGGKTGTANTLNSSTHRYSKTNKLVDFIGIFPMNNPQYSIFVIIDNPKTRQGGSKVAAPVVAKIIAQIAPILGIEPNLDNIPQKYFKQQIHKFEINYITNKP